MMDVFQALADENRRALLDRLFGMGGLTLGQLCEGMAMSRQAVSKHLGILESAGLVTVYWQGRQKLHYLNPVPIGKIVHRWVGKFEDARIDALAEFKDRVEQQHVLKKEKRRA